PDSGHAPRRAAGAGHARGASGARWNLCASVRAAIPGPARRWRSNERRWGRAFDRRGAGSRGSHRTRRRRTRDLHTRMTFERELDCAIAVAREAGALLKENFGKHQEIEYTGRIDL